MTIDAVSEAFAFVLENGEFTETILWSDDEIPELSAPERAAIDAVQKHVEASFVGLLQECRHALLAVAGPGAHLETMRQNENRPATIWKKGMVQVPLVIRRSWVAWLSIGIWPTGNEGQLQLDAHLGVQARQMDKVQPVVSAVDKDVKRVSGADAFAFPGLQPKAGDKFSALGRTMAERIWPVALAVRGALAPASSGDAAV